MLNATKSFFRGFTKATLAASRFLVTPVKSSTSFTLSWGKMLRQVLPESIGGTGKRSRDLMYNKHSHFRDAKLTDFSVSEAARQQKIVQLELKNPNIYQAIQLFEAQQKVKKNPSQYTGNITHEKSGFLQHLQAQSFAKSYIKLAEFIEKNNGSMEIERQGGFQNTIKVKIDTTGKTHKQIEAEVEKVYNTFGIKSSKLIKSTSARLYTENNYNVSSLDIKPESSSGKASSPKDESIAKDDSISSSNQASSLQDESVNSSGKASSPKDASTLDQASSLQDESSLEQISSHKDKSMQSSIPEVIKADLPNVEKTNQKLTPSLQKHKAGYGFTAGDNTYASTTSSSIQNLSDGNNLNAQTTNIELEPSPKEKYILEVQAVSNPEYLRTGARIRSYQYKDTSFIEEKGDLQSNMISKVPIQPQKPQRSTTMQVIADVHSCSSNIQNKDFSLSNAAHSTASMPSSSAKLQESFLKNTRKNLDDILTTKSSTPKDDNRQHQSSQRISSPPFKNQPNIFLDYSNELSNITSDLPDIDVDNTVQQQQSSQNFTPSQSPSDKSAQASKSIKF